jgi:hypothetical protein
MKPLNISSHDGIHQKAKTPNQEKKLKPSSTNEKNSGI